MRQSRHSRLALLLCVISMHLLCGKFVIVHAAITSAPIAGFSIFDDPAYSSLKYCAQGCICCRKTYAAVVEEGLGCASPWPDSCFCDTARQDVATSFLSSCISSYCEDSSEAPVPAISSALSVYGAYCVAAGYPAPGQPALTTAPSSQSDQKPSDGGHMTESIARHSPEGRFSTIASSTSAAASSDGSHVKSLFTVSTTSGNVPNPTRASGNSSSNNNEDNNGAGLSRADKMTLALTITIGLPATIAAITSCIYQIKDRSGLPWPLPMLVAFGVWRRKALRSNGETGQATK